jgi:hypothetical protein
LEKITFEQGQIKFELESVAPRATSPAPRRARPRRPPPYIVVPHAEAGPRPVDRAQRGVFLCVT